jgi:hypothetical protein
MIESPLIQELIDQAKQQLAHKFLLKTLETRFGAIPSEITAKVRAIVDEQKLDNLYGHALTCSDFESFRTHLES